MPTAPPASSSANCWMLENDSPVATGTGDCRATLVSTPMLWWETGSSSHAGRKGASRSAMRRAAATPKRPWASIIRSTSGPTSSRTASTRETDRSSSWPLWAIQAAPNGSNFMAVKPSSTTPRAASANASGVRSTVYQPLA